MGTDNRCPIARTVEGSGVCLAVCAPRSASPPPKREVPLVAVRVLRVVVRTVLRGPARLGENEVRQHVGNYAVAPRPVYAVAPAAVVARLAVMLWDAVSPGSIGW